MNTIWNFIHRQDGKKLTAIFWGVLITTTCLRIVYSLLLPQTTSAQATSTGFVPRCFVMSDPFTRQVHILAMSDGEAEYSVGLPTLTTNIPETLELEAGVTDIGFVEITAKDTPFQWFVSFTSPIGATFTLTLATWELEDCTDPTYVDPPNFYTGHPVDLPLPVVVSDGTECLLAAIDSSTGLPYCYEPSEWGIVPLPPSQTGS